MATRRQTRSSTKAEIEKTLPKKEPDEINISEDDDDSKGEQQEAECIVIEEEVKTRSRPKREVRQKKVVKKEEEEELSEEEGAEKKANNKKAKPRARSEKKQVAPRKQKEAAEVVTKQEAEGATVVEDVEEDGSPEIIYQLDEKEMKEVNNAFDLNCSDDGDELLASDALKTAIRSLGFEPRVDEIKRLVKKFGTKKGKVNRDGFHKIMTLKMSSSPGFNDKSNQNDEISRVFNLLDLERTGFITLENLKSISKELNETITDDELLEMMLEADLDGDNKINKSEFHNIMKKTNLY